ncbi:MAG TPA: hypothetical protein VGI57_07190, partial [Usitatibacter sp.]
PAHCAQGQQALEKPLAPLVPPAVLIGFASWRAIEATYESPGFALRRARLIAPPEPPLALRNCCLRI